MNDSYSFTDLENVKIKLGYKVKLVSILDGKKHFITKQPAINLTTELVNWLKELKEQLFKDEKWLSDKIKILHYERIFDFQTLLELPQCFWNTVGFDTTGLQKKLSLKKESSQNDNQQLHNVQPNVFIEMPDEPNGSDDSDDSDDCSDVSTENVPPSIDQNRYKNHKYYKVPDIKTLFKKGRGYTKAYNYFKKVPENKISPKDIENYKEAIYDSIIKDIKHEQNKVKELYPPFDILKNAGQARKNFRFADRFLLR